MATAVQVGRLPQLGPSVYQSPAGISLIPSLQVTEANTGIGAGEFGGSQYSTGPNSFCTSRNTECSSLVNRHAI